MAVSTRSPLGPFLYGALFSVALPAALVLWARAAAPAVALPALHAPWAGWTLLALTLAVVSRIL